MFETPTAFGPWRLMLRPVDTHAIRLIDAKLELSPPGETHWTRDAYNNSVCTYQPQGQARQLRIVNELLVERFPAPLQRNDPGSPIPIAYEAADDLVLAPFRLATFRESEEPFVEWVDRHAPYMNEPALQYLQRLTQQIASEFQYASREEEGTQIPGYTVAFGTGTCRDLAALMIETTRRFGFAARFASGYLHSPGGLAKGAGATHAWCEVYLPQLGWLEFDPTNGIAESADLIRVAATRTPEEAAPISGAALSRQHGKLSVRVVVEPAPIEHAA